MRSEYTGYIARTFLQLDEARQQALTTYAVTLLEQQRDLERAERLSDLPTRAELMAMNLDELEAYASERGVWGSSVCMAVESLTA